MALGEQRQVLFADTKSGHEEIPGTADPPHSPGDSLVNCLPTPPSEWSTTATFDDEAAAIGIFSEMGINGSYAIDRAGRLGLSQLITEFQEPHVSRGYQNVLTDGDLPGLIPGLPTNSGFKYDIRLIR